MTNDELIFEIEMNSNYSFVFLKTKSREWLLKEYKERVEWRYGKTKNKR